MFGGQSTRDTLKINPMKVEMCSEQAKDSIYGDIGEVLISIVFIILVNNTINFIFIFVGVFRGRGSSLKFVLQAGVILKIH